MRRSSRSERETVAWLTFKRRAMGERIGDGRDFLVKRSHYGKHNL
jgi:hypothetical protein